jgi:glycosyltransferase involved in cell wall biosynthesis
MRIHIVTSEYTGVTSYTGGIGTQYANLAPALAAQGDEVHVVTLTDNRPEVIERNGVYVVRVHVPRAPLLRPAQWPLAAERALRRLPFPDAVVAAEFSAGAAAYSLRRGRAPLVTHLHSSLLQIMRTSRWSLQRRLLPQSLLQRGLERVQAQRSDALLSPSTQLLDWAQRLWPIQKLPAEVVPNTIDVQQVRRLAEGDPPDELGSGGPLVVFSGRLEPRKGVHVLVDAMRSVWQTHPEARLALLGAADGEWEGRPISEHLLKLAGDHGERLLMLGHLPPERLFPSLAAADVVALPSLWEPFSLAALEAMALSRPLVVSSGVFPPYVRHDGNALLVPPDDPRALGEALVALLADSELRGRLGAAGAVTADDNDVTPSARRFVEALASVLGGPR